VIKSNYLPPRFEIIYIGDSTDRNLKIVKRISEAYRGKMSIRWYIESAHKGLVAYIYLTKMIRRLTSRITKLLMKMSVEQAFMLVAVLVVSGGAYTLYLFTKWVESGYCYLPLREENAMALALIVLGVQVSASALLARAPCKYELVKNGW